MFPALHNLVSLWAPKEEKGKFVSALLGGALGTVVTWMMLGVIIENLGWQYGFYIPAIMTFVFVAFWYYLVADAPAEHPRIAKQEVDLIKESLGDSVSKSKQLPPIFRVLTSIPFLSLMILHYGSLWGLYFLQTAAPMFMTEVLDFNLSKAGILSSLPHLARLLAGFGFGGIGDFIRRRNLINVTMTRKSFCIFCKFYFNVNVVSDQNHDQVATMVVYRSMANRTSFTLSAHIIPGLFLISIAYVAFNPYLCVAVVTLSLGFNGAAAMTNLQNAQDLAPNFAGTI